MLANGPINGPIYERDGDVVLWAPVPGVRGILATVPRLSAARLRTKLDSRATCAGTVANLRGAPPVGAFAPVVTVAGATTRPPAGFTLDEAMGLTAGFAALAELARACR